MIQSITPLRIREMTNVKHHAVTASKEGGGIVAKQTYLRYLPNLSVSISISDATVLGVKMSRPEVS